MPAYRAISSAVYGESKGTLVMSTSVVAAHGEDDIRLEETLKEPIDTSSPDSVRARFDHLLATLVRTVGKQKEVYGGLSVPVVFGVPKNFKGLDLTDTLRTAYAQLLGKHPVPRSAEQIRKEKREAQAKRKPKVTDQERRVSDFLSGRKGFFGRPNITRSAPADGNSATEDRGDVWDLDKPLVEHLLRQTCAERLGPGGWRKPAEKYKFDVSFHPRLFQPLHHGTQEALRSEDAIERIASRAAMIRPLRGNEFEEAYEKAMAGDQQALEKLRSMAREEARHTAEGYARHIAPGHSSRFVMIAPPIPPFTTRPEYNFLQWFDLRKVFGEEFAKLLNIQHPVCIKGPADQPSPAFADVAATYAFQLKRLADTGNQDGRGTVMITSRVDQTNTAPDPERGA
ncbi:MAG TPA: hypothetical protein PKV72_05540 [Candidatus Peribacteria bacterium]|nr:hypothetical protein [Candidatus Peribacteria bacterium]